MAETNTAPKRPPGNALLARASSTPGYTRLGEAQPGVDFADAVGALEDPLGLTRDDPTAEGESRFVTLDCGFPDRVLYVVWTERGLEVTRIISARKASAGEARQYEE